MKPFNPDLITLKSTSYEDLAEIADKYGKYSQWAQFYNKPEMFIHENNLYFVQSGTSDNVIFYVDGGNILELSRNNRVGYCGLTLHTGGDSENIVFLTEDDYYNAGIDLDNSSDIEIINHLLEWYN